MLKSKTIKVTKPWGQEFHFVLNEKATVKILEVNPGQKLSYQSHNKRDEYWRCVKNTVIVVLDDKKFILKEDDEIYIKRGVKHRLIGTNKKGRVLEIISGEYEAEDIIRYEDSYGRSGTTKV